MTENIRLAFQGIWGHKLRSFLTMLGIIIGIASIITIVSTIKGTNDQIKENLIGSGSNAVVVSLYQDDYTYEAAYGELPTGVGEVTPDLVSRIAELENVSAVSRFHRRDYADSIYYRDTLYSGSITGVDEGYFAVYDYRLCYGRLFTDEDRARFRKAVILDDKAASSLFGAGNPIGEILEIGGQPFTVIGVVTQVSKYQPVIESLGDYYTYQSDTTGSIFMPDGLWPTVNRFDEPYSVAVKASSTDAMTTVGKDAAELLTARLISNPTFSYRSEDLLEQAEQLQAMSSSSNQQLIWIAGISLLVGGIGVMNIMLVSVTERTREIGLKKAIGARKKKILWQFLTEASVLTTLGGILGILAGIGLARLLSMMIGIPTAISVPAILIAAIFSTVIGVVFGLLPATKAANMNPIDALRRD